MKTLEQAARQALDALEDSHQNINPERGFAEELQQQIAQATTALREALEQQQEPYDQQSLELCPACGWKALIPGDGCLICERTTQQQAPVAYIAWRDGKPCWDGDDCVCEDAVWPVDGDDDRGSMPVYLAPQQRKPWVGLTSEDKVEILRANGEAAVLILTEAKLREKNEPREKNT